MKFTKDWLSDHLKTKKSEQQIIDKLNGIGLEVEKVEPIKNELSDKFLKFLTKETHEYTYKELAAEFKCNFEHARRICIKLFTEGKIERTKFVKKVGRPYFKYWK